MPEYICETCKQSFHRPPSAEKYDPPRFCSPGCFYKWLNGSKRAPRVRTHCLSCGKEITVLKSRHDAGQGLYCSHSCINKGRPSPKAKTRIECTCQHCGKTFYKLQCQIDSGRGKFCSRACSGAYAIRHLTKEPTNIEQALIDELTARGIRFEFQYPVQSYTLDFAFPDVRLCVEADGVYWHSLSNVQEKDERKDKDLQASGWTVLHITEAQINESVSDCVNRIEHVLTSLS